VSRRTGFADLRERRVGIWGLGVEGRATLRRVGSLARSIVLVDDDPGDSDVLATRVGGFEALLECDVVLKSPGISRYRDDVVRLKAAGVDVTSSLNLWLAEADRNRVIGVTGTKGKSTTTSLITFFLHTLGLEAHSAGNIGEPPYDVDFASSGWIVLEISSFQSVELDTAPHLIVVTSLGSDHLDWHGTLERYRDDKLSVTRAEGDHITLSTATAIHDVPVGQLGGDVHIVASSDSELCDALGLLGEHNALNVQLALEAVSLATGQSLVDVRRSARELAHEFAPLPGRLTSIRMVNDVLFVDDGLATSPLPTIAALAVFADQAVSLIVGGHDRGVDYGELAEAVALRTFPTTIVTLPDAGERIADAIATRAQVNVVVTGAMSEAVNAARAALPHGGVVLLSPAAPSFGQYANWRERSDDFARVVAAFVE
jgi:UDP-N-acetylmuramoylalanine--D-glutamate ligase